MYRQTYKCNPSEFTPIFTSKFTEITLYACLVELGVNPLRLHCLLKALVVIISLDLHPI